MTHHTFALRSYRFRPPEWLPPGQLNVRTLALTVGSLGWLALYGWLAWRLLGVGVVPIGHLELTLIGVCIVLGVPLALGWWAVWQRWRARLRPAEWPALTPEQMHDLSPSDFERYVAQRLFARQGYTVINTPDVKDGGVDLIVVDTHGQQAIVQCKRYRGTVGEPVIRDLYGTLHHFDAQMAYLVTSGHISEAARRWVVGKPIGLIDGTRLAELSRAEPTLRPPKP